MNISSLKLQKYVFVLIQSVTLYLKHRKTKITLKSQFWNNPVAIIIMKTSEEIAMFCFYQLRNNLYFIEHHGLDDKISDTDPNSRGDVKTGDIYMK